MMAGIVEDDTGEEAWWVEKAYRWEFNCLQTCELCLSSAAPVFLMFGHFSCALAYSANPGTHTHAFQKSMVMAYRESHTHIGSPIHVGLFIFASVYICTDAQVWMHSIACPHAAADVHLFFMGL
jgi:hypothetical protein